MKSKVFISFVLLSSIFSLMECRAVRQAATCSFQTDDYSLSWEYDELSSDVVFKLSASSRNPSFWSGVYFGDDEKPSDVIGVFVRSGQIGLVDGYVNSENDIESDDSTNVQSLTFDLQNHTLTAEFARPLTSIDETDADLSNCVTFYFPVNAPAIDIGGPIEIPKNLIKKRICDLAVSCSSSHSLVVKRADDLNSATCKYESNDKQRSVSWQKVGENVLFSVEQQAKQGKWWTAIGVGESMQDLDLIVAFTENGEVQHTGGYKSVGYSSPESDETLTSAHKLDSFNVADDKSFFTIVVPMTFLSSRMENNCVTVQMGILAGTYAKKRNDFIIQKHRDSPIAVTVCNIDQCSVTENTSEPIVSLSTTTVAAASSTVPTNEILDVIIEKNVHQNQNQETGQDTEQELLSAENPKRDDDKSLEGSGQQAGIFETVSRELQEIQGSGENPDKSNSGSNEVLPNVAETNMTTNLPDNEQLGQKSAPSAENGLSVNPGLVMEPSVIMTDLQEAPSSSTSLPPAANQEAPSSSTSLPPAANQEASSSTSIPPAANQEASSSTSIPPAANQDVPSSTTQTVQELLSSTTQQVVNVDAVSTATSTEKAVEAVASSTINSVGGSNQENALSFSVVTPTPEVNAMQNEVNQMITLAPTSMFDLSLANLTAEKTSTDSNSENVSTTKIVNVDEPTNVPLSNASPSLTSAISNSELSTTTITLLNSPSAQKDVVETNGSGEEPAVPEVTSNPEGVSSTPPTVAVQQQSTEAAAPQTVSVGSNVAMLNTLVPEQTCPQEDLKVCQSYFDDYLIKVADWARRHEFSAASQQWKACKLLSEVKNVPTLCCNRYQKECVNVTPPPQ